MLCEPVVDKGVLRIPEISCATVVSDKVEEESAGFLEHGRLEQVVELLVQLFVRGGGVNLPQLQPVVGEPLNESAGIGRSQQAFCLRKKHSRIQQPSRVCRGTQLVIRWRAPEKETEPRSQRVCAQRSGRLVKVQKLGRQQNSAVRSPERLWK